jgi:hypothetical protein
MNRYKNGKIYKIVDNTNGNIYIGSTCVPTLSIRLAQHRCDYKNFIGGSKNTTTSIKILENNNYSIVLLEEFPCETKDQLLSRERYYIENNDCINKNIPTRSRKEYYEQIKEQLKEHQKDYYEQNKDKIKERRKEYYEKNKDKIKEQKKQTITCECGSCVSQGEKSRHFKTKRHLKYLETQK